jgi:uncharacterized YigZ family protein
MILDDSYQTIAQPSEGFFKDRGSKFLAYAYPIDSEETVKTYLQSLHELHPKAVHHCYAYRLGLDKNNFRANDDGEPAGSAGKPILNVLYANHLTHILIVVVRYFGGTLLGVPGLIHAYKTATEEAIEAATIITQYVKESYEIGYNYEQMHDVMRVVKTFDLPLEDQIFDNNCRFKTHIRKAYLSQVLGHFNKIESIQLTHLQTYSPLL